MARDYTREEVLDIIEREANARGIPRDDFLRFAYIETGGQFDEHASRGPGGAKGLFQFVPGTAEAYGIRGREFDAVANTQAAAQLYLDNRDQLVNRHQRDGRPYLSGKPEPDGLDMYLAHQQGAGGYRSLQTAIATGQFSLESTRANLLNNVSSRDIEAITGRSHADFRQLSDRELAATFVEYWGEKFDRVRIAEKGIEPVARVPSEPAPGLAPVASAGIALEAAHALSIKHDDVKYGFGVKDPASGKVDCSGWVVTLQNATMDEINAKAGHSVFAREDRFKPEWDSAAAIVQKAQARSGVLLEGGEISRDALKEGMIIGEDNGPKSWDRGRYKGIDHIVMVVRDPATNELMVSQSRGGEGVELSRLDDYLEGKQARGVKLYATDPLAQARELLHDRSQEQGQNRAAPTLPTTGNHASMADGLLRRGEKGEPIRDLQQSLHELGYTGRNGKPLVVDGDFGGNTEHAVRAYQRDHGLKVDGIAGPRTLEAVEQQRRQEQAQSQGSPAAQDAMSRLDRLASGQVDPAARQAWDQEVAACRPCPDPVREQESALEQRQAQQTIQAEQGR